MIWLASLAILLLSFSQYDIVEGRWSNNNSPWSNRNQANSFMKCLVQNIASSPAFPLQEREDLESVVQTMLAAITGLVSSHRGNTATQIQAMNMAFASSMAELIIAEDAGNSQIVAAKTNALQEELTSCFKSVFGVVNRRFINEVQELIRMFAEEAASSDTYNELDIGIDYGFGQSIGFGNAGSISGSVSGTAGSLSTSTSTSKSTSTSTAAAAGSAAGAAGAAGAAFGAGFGGFAGAGSLVNSFASALAGSSVFQSIFGSGISTNLAASIAISAVQASLSSVVSVSNSVSVGISNSLQSAIFNIGAGASASAYASAIASSVVSGLSSAGVLSSSSASSIVSSLVSVLLQNASAIAAQYGISVSGAAGSATSAATSATSTSTSTAAAAGSAAGAAGAAGSAFGAGFGAFSGADGFLYNILPNVVGQHIFNNDISLPSDFTTVISSPVGLTSQQSVSRIEGIISHLVQSFSSNGISISAVWDSIRRIFGETSALGFSASEATFESLLEMIVALLQILLSSTLGNVSFSSIPDVARSLGQYAVLG